MQPNKSSTDVMECINGIRVFSIIWVAYAHSYTSFRVVGMNMMDLYTVKN